MRETTVLEIVNDEAPLEIENKGNYFLVTIRKSDLPRLSSMLQALEQEADELPFGWPCLTSTGRPKKEITLTIMKEP